MASVRVSPTRLVFGRITLQKVHELVVNLMVCYLLVILQLLLDIEFRRKLLVPTGLIGYTDHKLLGKPTVRNTVPAVWAGVTRGAIWAT